MCDVYRNPSIKEVEWNRRGGGDIIISITGPEQKRPRDWQQALKCPSFNVALIRFLAEEWRGPQNAGYLSGKKIYLGFDSVCYSFCTEENAVVRNQMQKLSCDHEEADTRTVFHMYHITNNSPEVKIVIRTNDSDVLVIVAAFMNKGKVRPLKLMRKEEHYNTMLSLGEALEVT